MKDYILEACVGSVESALAAERGGATRLELCGELIVGGVTPSLCLFQEIRKHSKIRTHILIRPRFGDFCYTDFEFEIMKAEVAAFREMGAEGAVIGILKPDGTLDTERLKVLRELAGEMSLTLHRAFDVCAEPMEAMEQAIALGFDTILTSGQRNSCLEGAELLKELEKASGGRIVIQAGAGINAEAIKRLYPITGGRAYHMSGKTVIDSSMKYRKEGVNMGLGSISEYEIWRTDEDSIRAAREVLEAL